MIRKLAILATLVLLSGVARAQTPSLADRMADKVGQTLDLRIDSKLREELADRGLIERNKLSVKVDAAFLEKVIGNERLRAYESIRYRAGDRVYVETGGNLNYRGEISKVNADGTYTVKVWDRLESVNPPKVGDAVNAVTGAASPNTPPTTVRRPGSTTTESMVEPWLERVNVREIKVTHADLDRLNGQIDAGAGREYNVNGYVVNLEKDETLKERVDAANAVVDKLIKSGRLDLTLPEEPAARAKKIAEIAELQRKIAIEIFKTNEMGYLRGDWAMSQWAKMQADAALKLNGRTMVGGVLKYGVGVCTDQTAALAAVMREIGRRMGFDVRVIHGANISGGGHNFMNVRTIDGHNFIMDPSWHSQSSTPWAALENIDFATFDKRWWADREINQFGENVDKPRTFADEKTRAAVDRAGLSDHVVEKLIAAEVAERLKPGMDAEKLAREVAAEKLKTLPFSGDRTALATRVVAEARAIPVAGITNTLTDRANDNRDRTSRSRVR